MSMEVGRLWFVRLPMIWLFGHFTNWGSTGIWFSMGFSNAVVCLYGYWIYKKRPWQRSVLKLQTDEASETLGLAN
jgi:Na+-driven multidrug efflux pump